MAATEQPTAQQQRSVASGHVCGQTKQIIFGSLLPVCKQGKAKQKKKNTLSWDTEKTNTKAAAVAAAVSAAAAAVCGSDGAADIVTIWLLFGSISVSHRQSAATTAGCISHWASSRFLSCCSTLRVVILYVCITLCFGIFVVGRARARVTLTTAQTCPLAGPHSAHWVAVQCKWCFDSFDAYRTNGERRRSAVQRNARVA